MSELMGQTLRKLRYDLTAAQAKVTDALNLLEETSRPPLNECPTCSYPVRGPKALVEHMENVHGQYESERPRAC